MYKVTVYDNFGELKDAAKQGTLPSTVYLVFDDGYKAARLSGVGSEAHRLADDVNPDNLIYDAMRLAGIFISHRSTP